jgi:Cu-processing system permease protein
MTTLFAPAVGKVLKYELSDVIRSKWVAAYALFFLVVTDALFRFGGGSAHVVLSLMNVVLVLIPLVSLIFGTIYLYSAREFTELMLAQPVRRGHLFAGLYGGLVLPLAAGFALGVTLPFLWHGGAAGAAGDTLALLVLVGVLLTAAFLALALLIAVRFDDRMKGLAAALVAWLFFAVVYDGLVLVAVHAFSAYPLEKPLLALTILNPVDLGRVLLLLNVDVAALLGYTGAVFERFFGTGLGFGVALLALGTWCAVPLALAHRLFTRKDF